MDMIEFQRDYGSKYKECDTDISFMSRLAVVKFEIDSRGRVAGKCRFGYVFRHKESEDQIKLGETWVCELTENYNADRQYFAKGVMRIDSAFIMDLRQDQMQTIADALWDEHRDYFSAMFESKYGEIVEQKVEEKASQTIDEYQRRIDLLQTEVEALKERKEQLETEVRERESLIERMSEHRDKEPLTVNKLIRRIDPDTLYSEGFSGRYDVRFTADGRKMMMTHSENGPIESVGGEVKLRELRYIKPFTESEILLSDCEDGRLVVSLI